MKVQTDLNWIRKIDMHKKPYKSIEKRQLLDRGFVRMDVDGCVHTNSMAACGGNVTGERR